jgi:hypothetical protein
MKEVGPLACLDGLIKPNQASHQGAKWTSSVSMLKVPVLALIIETSAVWPWYTRPFQDICRGLWIIIAELTCGLFPMIFRMVFPSWSLIVRMIKSLYSQTELFHSILTYWRQLSYLLYLQCNLKNYYYWFFSVTPCREQACSVIHSLSVSTTTFNLTFRAAPGEHMVHRPFHFRKN